MITVDVTVGVGMWKAQKVVRLIACPHVGDRIHVGEQVVECDRVTIGESVVYVEQTRRFQSEADAKEFFTS